MDKFSALADPTRRSIIEMLASHGHMASSDIGTHFPISPPAISQHLKVLREAGLVVVEKRAQQRIYSLNDARIAEMEQWFGHMRTLWMERFDTLDALLKQEIQKQNAATNNMKEPKK